MAELRTIYSGLNDRYDLRLDLRETSRSGVLVRCKGTGEYKVTPGEFQNWAERALQTELP